MVAVWGLALLTGCATPPDRTLPAVETEVDPDTWSEIPAGPFVQGQHEEKTTVHLAYEMMTTNVTNAQYARFLNEGLRDGYVKIDAGSVVGYYPGDLFHGGSHERRIAAGAKAFLPMDDPALRLTLDGDRFDVQPGYDDHPMTMVSWFGAWGYCDFYGWRLPSDDEWEKAARGTDNRPFPWGDDLSTQHTNFINSRDPFERIFERAGGTTPVGLYDGRSHGGYVTLDGRSPHGLFDMAGNVWQWTGDVREGTHYRSLRGGSHTSYAYNLRIWSHNNADPTHTSPTVGFRCARSIE
jgi:formylglycine-generating enzyme required for sulfatase activity